MSDLVKIFIEETNENLQIFEEGLLELENNPSDRDSIDEIFRAIHTIKGGSGLTEQKTIKDITHLLENILDKIRESKEKMPPELFPILFQGNDILKKMITTKDLEGEYLEREINELKEAIYLYDKSQINETIKPKAMKKDSQDKYYKININLNENIFDTGTDPIMLLLELNEAGKIIESYANISNVPFLDEINPEKFYIKWTIFYQSNKAYDELMDIFIFVKDENEINVEDITDSADLWLKEDKKTGELLVEKGLVSSNDIEETLKKQKQLGQLLYEEGKITKKQLDKVLNKQKVSRNTELSNTIRVDSSKLEKILNYVAELLIAHSKIKEQVMTINDNKDSKDEEIMNSFEETDKIIRLLQEEVLNASMVPIGSTFIRFQRMARDLGREKNKEIEVELKGRETELDKKIIEQITDPLKHLIRNAVDHGIELPDERKSKNKPEKGTIILNSYHQEGNIIIEISDDGKGIDEEKILTKAKEKGFLKKDEKPLEKITDYLFIPGFTTTDQVSEISGRGVGLDVVMTNVKKLRGNLDVTHEKDKGTKFRIKLPLTLAIIDGIVVRVGEERFIIPITSIVEFLKIKEEDMKFIEGTGMVIHLRDEFIPYKPLYSVFEIEPDYKEATEGIAVIIKESNRKLALMVDEIVDQEQVVIKSINETVEQSEGIAGGTIMGDGKVAIILDIPSLIQLSKKKQYNYEKYSFNHYSDK